MCYALLWSNHWNSTIFRHLMSVAERLTSVFHLSYVVYLLPVKTLTRYPASCHLSSIVLTIMPLPRSSVFSAVQHFAVAQPCYSNKTRRV